jgi:hypothetical protein
MAMRRMVIDLQSTAPTMALPEWAADRLRTATPAGWELVIVQSPTDSSGDGTNTVSAETMAVVPSAEGYFGYGLPPALVSAAPSLRWAHSASAGVGASITPELLSAGLVFTNSAGVYAEAMADTVLAGVMYFVRGLDHAARLQRAGTWDKHSFQMPPHAVREIAGLRVLVVGAGGIGSAVATRFAALGAVCTGVRRRPALGVPAGFARVVGPSAVDAELPGADVLVHHQGGGRPRRVGPAHQGGRRVPRAHRRQARGADQAGADAGADAAIALRLIASETMRAHIDKLRDYDCSWGAGGRALPREHPAAALELHDRDARDPVRGADVRRAGAAAGAGAHRASGARDDARDGVTGSGKSSTMAALMIAHQRHTNKHIVTLENPIEFLHRDLQSSVTQREIGVDTESFRRGCARRCGRIRT